MLTQSFISKIQSGGTPGAPSVSPSQPLTDDAAYNAWKNGSPIPSAPVTPSAPAADPTQTLGAMDAQQVLQGGQKIAGSISDASDRIAARNEQAPTLTNELGKAGDALEGGLGAASGAIQSIFAPLTATVQKLSQTASDNSSVQAFAQKISPVLDGINTAGHPLNQWAQQNPRAATDLADALNVGLTAIGGGEGDALLGAKLNDGAATLKGAASDAVDATKTGIQATKDAVLGTPEEQAAKATADAAAKAKAATQSSIDAVNPDLSGKKLTAAYKDTVTGKRDVTPASIFKEQGLTPDQQAVNLGTRLQDLNLGKDPVKNLDILKTALNDTETKIGAALKGDPDVNYNADKPTLLTNLNDIKTTIPREFKSIKDSKAVFNNVVDFAKETIGKSDDTIEGLRDARTTFDNQAKLEYPNAFKNGMVDVKTPAGRAIKQARDMMNEHLYNTAPNGSEIQKLIGREADIFRATENIAPKAAETHGQNLYDQTLDRHPVLKAGVNTVKKVIPFGIGTHI